MIFPLTGIGIASAITFSTWHFTSLIIKIRQNLVTYMSGLIETLYIFLMSYFLVTLSSMYLIILLSVVIMRTFMGGLALLTPMPDDYATRKNEIVENFWIKTAADAIIGLICYCVMLWGGIIYE